MIIRVPNAVGSRWNYSTRAYETLRGYVEVEIDEGAVARQLAATALHNRTGKTQFLSGLIKAKVIKRY